MQLFDSHSHLNSRRYTKDMPQVMTRARAAGVAGIMVVGVDGPSSHQALSLARELNGDLRMIASVGVHPHDAQSCSEALLEELRRVSQAPEIKAWGETGLDFFRMRAPQADQEKWFQRQLQIARAQKLPLILHERDSQGRFGDLLARHWTPDSQGVVHCFSGSAQDLGRYLELGLHIGITGIVTHQQRGADLRRMIPDIPADRLLIETDAPYLTPSPERNRTNRNEPAFVGRVLSKIADVRGNDPAALADRIWQNTCRLFGVPEAAGR